MHTYMDTLIHTNMNTYIHTYMHVCMHAHIHTYIIQDPRVCAKIANEGMEYLALICCVVTAKQVNLVSFYPLSFEFISITPNFQLRRDIYWAC